MTVSTFFPDADPETSSVDGLVIRGSVDEAWATIRAGAGTSATPSDGNGDPAIVTGSTTDQWIEMTRAILVFDTSALPDSDSIHSATLGIVLSAVTDDFSTSISLVRSTPASETDLVSADYGQLGTVKQATDLTIASLTADGATVNNFALNASGLGNISKTARSLFGIRHTPDVDNAEPTWSITDRAQINMSFAEEVSAGDDRPRLVVTHSTVADFTSLWAAMSLPQPIQIPTGMRPY